MYYYTKFMLDLAIFLCYFNMENYFGRHRYGFQIIISILLLLRIISALVKLTGAQFVCTRGNDFQLFRTFGHAPEVLF